MANYLATDTDLTAVANAIRTKGGTSAQMAFPNGFVSAVQAIPTGGGYTLNDVVESNFGTGKITYNGTHLKPFMFYESDISEFESDTVEYLYGDGMNSGQGTFMNCTKITRISMPNLIGTGAGGYQFAGCTSLIDLHVPNASVGQHFIDGCTSLETFVSIRELASSNGSDFANCTALKTVDLNMNRLTTLCFSNDVALTKLIMRRSTAIATLQNINVFNNTPFASGKSGGTLYVPQALIASYQAATNWSTILGYPNNQILSIEGSIYETKYADGTPITQGGTT